MVAHNFLKNQFSINLDYTRTSATVYFIQAQIMTMPVLLGGGAPEERNKLQVHPTSWHSDNIVLGTEEVKSADVLPNQKLL